MTGRRLDLAVGDAFWTGFPTSSTQQPLEPRVRVEVVGRWRDGSHAVQSVMTTGRFWGMMDTEGVWIEFYAGDAPREVRGYHP